MKALQCLIVGVSYYIAGKLALLLAIPPGYATAVWPGAGIALAGMLLCGYRAFPAIVVGSFCVNFWTSLDAANAASILKSIFLTTSIGIGAALQASLGAFLVRRFVGFPTSLTEQKDVLRFLLLGGPVSCVVNASAGVTT